MSGAMPEPAVCIEPLDEHNRKLVANVHPPDWVNPEPRGRYNLVVIGAGTAGLVTAAGARRAGRAGRAGRAPPDGRRLPERRLRAVEGRDPRRRARGTTAREAQRRFGGPRRERRPATSAPPWSACGGSARASAPIDGRRASATSASTSSSARAASRRRTRSRSAAARCASAAPSSPPARAPAARRSRASPRRLPHQRDVFALTELPRAAGGHRRGPDRLRAGPGVRAASAREVTLLDAGRRTSCRARTPTPPRSSSAALRATASGSLLGATVEARRGAAASGELLHVERRRAAPSEIAVDEILVAAGRAPNVEGLGLEAAGVRTTSAASTVDDRLRTTQPAHLRRRRRLLRVPVHPRRRRHGAHRGAERAVLRPRGKASRLVDAVVHLHRRPRWRTSGLTSRRGGARASACETITVPLARRGPRHARRRGGGFLGCISQEGTDRILGATLVAAHAGDMIGEITLAITAGVGLGKIGSTIHPYPTQAEAFRKAADAWRRTSSRRARSGRSGRSSG